MKRFSLFAGSAIVLGHLLPAGVEAQEGYSILENQVVVNSQSHWENWEFAEGTLEISPSGELRPQHWRRRTNAVLDIVDHLRWNPPQELARTDPAELSLLDVIQGVSNREDVVNVFDGDLTTYWEPEIPSGDFDLATQWWFTIDLGRIVLADRVVLKFVEEGLGDPFLLFDVLVSNGQAPGTAPASKSLDFRPVIQTLRPNKSQRVFEADLSSSDPPVVAAGTTAQAASLLAQVEGTGTDAEKRSVRFVQVAVHGSDLDRGQEIGEEEYNRLLEESPEDAGAIDYIKRLSNGGEVTLEPGDYERLDEDLKGGIRYYRRERPRLAELEVWGPGDDLANGVIRRKGSIVNSAPTSVNPLNLIDGNIESQEKMRLSNSDPNRLTDELFIDLGSFFWISGFRLAGGRGAARARSWFDYRLDVSDGTREVDGGLRWLTVAERNGGRSRIILNIEEFRAVTGRFFRIEWDVGFEALPRDNLGDALLSELQLYGEGYQPRVELTSSLIQLGGSRNLTTIEWDSDHQPGTRVEVQTRTGNSLDTLLHYFKADGTEISEAAYNKIRIKTQKGPIVPEEVAGGDWEPWSEPYEVASGTAITSPSPRKYLKVRARLLSDDPSAFATLDAVRVNFSDPVAESLQGQVIPTRVDSLGVERGFKLLVEFGSLLQSFDELLITPPPGMEVRFDPVGDAVFAGPASALVEGGDPGGFRLENVRLVSDTPDSLHLAFDEVSSEAEALRVDFRGILLTAGGRLQAHLRNSEGEGFWQRVDEKNPRSSLQLVAQPEHKLLFRDLAISPRVFSPNGDGVNDELRLDFTVMMVGASTAVAAEIFDLTGRRVRRLEEQREVSAGDYSIAWDGRDEADELVPPGLYAVRLKLASDTGDTGVGSRELLRTVALTY